MFSPDDTPPLSARVWGFVRARLINDVTNEPVGGNILVGSDLPRSSPRVSTDGLIGLAAIPRDVFPTLASRNYMLMLSVTAAGYIPRTVSVAIRNDQRMTRAPFPQAGQSVITMNDVTRLQPGETLMIGNPLTHPGSQFETVQVATVDLAQNRVTTRGPLVNPHDVIGAEPVIPVVPTDFSATDIGDIRLVPQP